MSLSRDEDAMLTHIQNLIGGDKMKGFVAALRNPVIGDRLSAFLQFLAAEGFTDEVVIAVTLALADPAFDAANATLEEIKGIAYVLKGAVEAERTLDVASLKEIRARAAEQFATLEARRANRMQKPQLLAHLAAKSGLSENAIESVLNELAELAIQEQTPMTRSPFPTSEPWLSSCERSEWGGILKRESQSRFPARRS
jgi:hypothetical protein